MFEHDQQASCSHDEKRKNRYGWTQLKECQSRC